MDDKLIFRRAQAQDFPSVLSLACQLAAHIEADTPPLTVHQFESYYLRGGAPMQLLLAILGNKVCGMISWTVTHELYSADTRVYISDLAIVKDARRHGIGAALMQQVIAWAAANGANKLGWDVWRYNETAKAFYESLGAQADTESLPYVLKLQATQL